MEEKDVYTQDGTVDIHKNPANKEKTGNWKACRFILGNVLIVFNSTTFFLHYCFVGPGDVINGLGFPIL